MELELGGRRGGRELRGVTEDEVEAEVRWCCSSGLGNDCAVWKQDGQSVGLTRWLAKEVRFGRLLPTGT